MKICPMCAEDVQDVAVLCRYCQHRFDGRPALIRDGGAVRVKTSRLTWVGVVGLVLLVGMCAWSPGEIDKPEAATRVALDDDVVAQCRDGLATLEKNKVILGRPTPNRLNVNELYWNQTNSERKGAMLGAVSCDVWKSFDPPSAEHVVAYGFVSGKRLAILTSTGVTFD